MKEVQKLNIMESFRMWGSNAKTLVVTEVLWSLPMSWVFFYRPIFLKEILGLSEIQIGFLGMTISVFSVFAPLLGGYLADRFGRKKVFIMFDSIGWLSSLAIWIITRNIFYALAAYVMEGVVTIVYPVWECLLVEDTKPKYRAGIYGTVSAIYYVGVMCTPLAGYFIGFAGIDLGSRLLFILAFVSLIPMFIIRQQRLRETGIGHQIMENRSLDGFKGYRSSLSLIRKNRIIIALLFTSITVNFYNSVSVYLPLYLVNVRGLGLSLELASLVPTAVSVSALIVSLFLVSSLTKKSSYLNALMLGCLSGCTAFICLTVLPSRDLASAMLSGVFLGIYQGIFFSVSRTFLTNEIENADRRARVKILSLTVTLSYLLNLPTPIIAGYLFSLDPRMPFILVSLVLTVNLALLLSLFRHRI